MWATLLACGSDPEPTVRGTGDTGEPAVELEQCPVSPCVADLGPLRIDGPDQQGWYGQQLATLQEPGHSWLLIGAPSVPEGYAHGRAELLDLPSTERRGIWEVDRPWTLMGGAVALHEGLEPGQPLTAVGDAFSSVHGSYAGVVHVFDELSGPAPVLATDSARLSVWGDGEAFRRPRLGFDVDFASLDGTGATELIVAAPGLFNAQTESVPFGSAIYAYSPTLVGQYFDESAATKALHSTETGLWQAEAWDGDGDGIDDLVAVQGGVYDTPTRLYRFPSPWISDWTPDDASTTWTFASYSVNGDVRIRSLTDLTGDGRPELAALALVFSEEVSRAGGAWLIEGGDLGGGELTDVPLRWYGTFEGEAVGSSASSADLDGDGQADLVIGAHAVVPADVPGKIAVFLGPLTSATALEESDADAIVYGEHVGDAFGIKVAAIDSDRDGRTDLAVGASNWQSGRGQVYLLEASTLFP